MADPSLDRDRPMPSSFDDDLEFWDEGRWSKLGRKLKEEPLVPFGLGLTCYALYGATRSIRKGDKESTNRYFRARVYAQGFTLVCVCAGALYYKEDREKRKKYQGLLGEKRAMEKREAWIRELEARDKEEEGERIARRARREAARVGAVGGGTAPVRRPVGGVEGQAGRDDGVNSSPVEGKELRGLLVGGAAARIVVPAMARWWG